MPANYVLLGEVTLGASAASITLSNIPQTGYTDLKLVFSLRSDTTGVTEFEVELNNTNPTQKVLRGNGASASSNTQIFVTANASGTTSNTFSNGEVYIPNYTSTNAKTTSIDNITENNGTTAYAELIAGLYSTVTTAVTSIRLADNYGSWVAGSTVYLYGLAAVGTTPVIAPFATGGDIIQNDGTYWIHTFLSSGTFTPAKTLTCDYLVVAGGGGGAENHGGGGGAGGLRCTVTATGGGGSLESALSLTAQAYTVTIGAGGANNASGVNSTFSTITSTGGGTGAQPGVNNAATGGSGGGGDTYSDATQTSKLGAAGTANQGFAGGDGNTNATPNKGAGGGGAGAVGGNSTGGNTSTSGAGGNGVAVSITGTSVNYAGGGGGGVQNGAGSAGAGGNGGGGAGGAGNGTQPGTAGTANTGGGGGGGAGNSRAGGAGGSGIVIVRYPIA